MKKWCAGNAFCLNQTAPRSILLFFGGTGVDERPNNQTIGQFLNELKTGDSSKFKEFSTDLHQTLEDINKALNLRFSSPQIRNQQRYMVNRAREAMKSTVRSFGLSRSAERKMLGRLDRASLLTCEDTGTQLDSHLKASMTHAANNQYKIGLCGAIKLGVYPPEAVAYIALHEFAHIIDACHMWHEWNTYQTDSHLSRPLAGVLSCLKQSVSLRKDPGLSTVGRLFSFFKKRPAYHCSTTHQAGEATADWLAAEAFPELLASLKPEAMANPVLAAESYGKVRRAICSTSLWDPESDYFGVHPHGHDRMEKIYLAQPKIRQALFGRVSEDDLSKDGPPKYCSAQSQPKAHRPPSRGGRIEK